MALSVNQNVSAFNAYRNLSVTQGNLSKSLEKLSSGFRINRAADDAAGLAISEGLRAQVNGLNQAVRNAQDGISVAQTAEGALNEVAAILQRVRTLTVQAGNDSNNADARGNIGTEITALTSELDRIAKSTSFNGKDLLTASAAASQITFQVGAGANSATNQIAVSLVDVEAVASAVSAVAVTSTFVAASVDAALSAIDAQIQSVSTARANLGAVQNRFEHTVNNLNVAVENLTASESRIRDTDMAAEMVKFTSSQILAQAGTAMLGQAKNLPQSVLSLLQN